MDNAFWKNMVSSILEKKNVILSIISKEHLRRVVLNLKARGMGAARRCLDLPKRNERSTLRRPFEVKNGIQTFLTPELQSE